MMLLSLSAVSNILRKQQPCEMNSAAVQEIISQVSSSSEAREGPEHTHICVCIKYVTWISTSIKDFSPEASTQTNVTSPFKPAGTV